MSVRAVKAALAAPPVLTPEVELAALADVLKASAPGEERRAKVARVREVIDGQHGGHTLQAKFDLQDFLFKLVTA